jgi:hypothetical protein
MHTCLSKYLHKCTPRLFSYDSLGSSKPFIIGIWTLMLFRVQFALIFPSKKIALQIRKHFFDGIIDANSIKLYCNQKLYSFFEFMR